MFLVGNVLANYALAAVAFWVILQPTLLGPSSLPPGETSAYGADAEASAFLVALRSASQKQSMSECISFGTSVLKRELNSFAKLTLSDFAMILA